jgi:hypothetical protein
MIETASGWLVGMRDTPWFQRWATKPAQDPANWANRAEEVAGTNQAFLSSFSEGNVTKSLYDFAVAHAGDGTLGPHCRAASSADLDDVVTLEQGMHQPESGEDDEGFVLHCTGRLTKTTVEDDQASIGKAAHIYMQQDGSGNLYVTEMTL